MEPTDQCGDPEVFVEDVEVEWEDLQAQLEIDYYMARVGPWRDGVPDWAISEARRIARTTADYTTQTFPVTDTTMRYAGVMRFSDADHREMEQEVAEGNAGGVRDYLTQSTHDQLASARQVGGDIRLLFTPYSRLKAVGVAEWDLGVDFNARHDTEDDIRFSFPTIQMTITKGTGDAPLTSETMLVSHELGHIYGLEHEPEVLNDAVRSNACEMYDGQLYRGIEGFRIELDGYPGFNKSSTEGNAQTDGTLYPMMFPCGGPVDEYWIRARHYRELIDNISEINARPLP